MTGNLRRRSWLGILLLVGFCPPLLAQTAPTVLDRPLVTDTLRLTLAQAEQRFTERNLNALAQRYNVSGAQAQTLQAGLRGNLTVYLENNLVNPNVKDADGTPTGQRQWFPTGIGQTANGFNGENVVTISKLLLLGSKRAKNVALAQTNAELTEYGLYDLLRNLRYQLRSAMFTIYYLQQTLVVYEQETRDLTRLVGAYQTQFDRGNVPLKDLVRLQAFLFGLQTDQKNLRNQVTDGQNNLMILLGETGTPYILPQFDRATLDSLTIGQGALAYPQLVETARQNRFDLKQAEANVRYTRQNLAVQRALAIPDLRLGFNYDRNGSYIPNYYAANLTLDLPVFNRNQGNIRSAEFGIKNGEARYTLQNQQVEKDVWQAYVQLQESDRLYKSLDRQFVGRFTELIEGVTRSYQRGNLSLVEFMDYYESYKANVLQSNQLQSDRMNGFEYLNFATGKTLFAY